MNDFKQNTADACFPVHHKLFLWFWFGQVVGDKSTCMIVEFAQSNKWCNRVVPHGLVGYIFPVHQNRLGLIIPEFMR
jgi:hypothetical protein